MTGVGYAPRRLSSYNRITRSIADGPADVEVVVAGQLHVLAIEAVLAVSDHQSLAALGPVKARSIEEAELLERFRAAVEPPDAA